MWSKWLPRTFNDFFAILVMALILLVWTMDAGNLYDVNEQVVGATIAAFVLIIQFYFRQRPPTNE